MTDARSALLAELTDFFRRDLLDAEQGAALTAQTSLREWGALNSLKMAQLIGWIRETLQVEIPMRKLTGANFRTLDDIADLILHERTDSPVS